MWCRLTHVVAVLEVVEVAAEEVLHCVSWCTTV